MGEKAFKRVRLIRPGDEVWEESMRFAEETDPAGHQSSALRSNDERFSCGLWERDVQRRYFEGQYHEVDYIIEGRVEITDDDGELYVAGPGDILVLPHGSKGYWKNLERVKMFYAIYEDPTADLDAYTGPGGF